VTESLETAARPVSVQADDRWQRLSDSVTQKYRRVSNVAYQEANGMRRWKRGVRINGLQSAVLTTNCQLVVCK